MLYIKELKREYVILEMGSRKVRTTIKRVTEITSHHMTPELKGIGREFFLLILESKINPLTVSTGNAQF